MELNSRIVSFQITAKEDVIISPFTLNDVTLLFVDVYIPVGLVNNHNDSTDFFVLFQNDEHIIEVCKFIGTQNGWEPLQN